MKSIIVHDRLKVERFYRFIMKNDLAIFTRLESFYKIFPCSILHTSAAITNRLNT